MLPFTATANQAYGPLPADFTFEVHAGYRALVGVNNAGKSSILNMTFARADETGQRDWFCLLLPDRYFLAGTGQTNMHLAAYNGQLAQQMRSNALPYTSQAGPTRAELFNCLLNHHDYQEQIGRLGDLLHDLGLPRLRVQRQQRLRFEDIDAYAQGTGLRAALPILAALTDPEIEMLLIDEPETSLEPSLQRALRDRLRSESENRAIIVATHSHLFLDREEPSRNLRVERDADGRTTAQPLSSPNEVADAVFRLLGNSPLDLYLPGNFLVVEGASDQRVAERILDVWGVGRGVVKVISGAGIDGVRNRVSAISQALVPLITNDSPYAARVVALVDAAPAGSPVVQDLRARLGDRLHELPQASLEEYLPGDLYALASLDKTEVLERVRRAGGRREELATIKTQVADATACVLTADSLGLIPELCAAVDHAVRLARV